MMEKVADENEKGKQERYFVHLPVFDGPLDLLLHLIEKRQMEITMISLVEVTDQYMDYLGSWQAQELPLANMASFVSIATRLLFLKSQSLLPQSPKEQEDEMDEAATIAEELQQHLLEYKIVKEITQVLREYEESGLQTYARSGLLAGIEAQLTWTPPALAPIQVQSLASAFQRVLETRVLQQETGSDLMPTVRIRVSECVTTIRQRLERDGLVPLAKLLEQSTSRMATIVMFIAVLELWKWERIEVQQEILLGPIVLERGGRWEESWQALQLDE
jgi:segregation and condensation protein A